LIKRRRKIDASLTERLTSAACHASQKICQRHSGECPPSSLPRFARDQAASRGPPLEPLALARPNRGRAPGLFFLESRSKITHARLRSVNGNRVRFRAFAEAMVLPTSKPDDQVGIGKDAMASMAPPRLVTILTGRNLPKILQPRPHSP
jgi:hypothetical protein